ncbi:hypothetical protein BT69DRAFT_882194 [Atractiella rhizophila]|nr:hypothetical protein BT69DRAFT_998729 [Atractiella rhizophila]KAH8915463.1 hypothetical protein BT69DRAFT_882194 [Atractiella rhizophila]
MTRIYMQTWIDLPRHGVTELLNILNARLNSPRTAHTRDPAFQPIMLTFVSRCCGLTPIPKQLLHILHLQGRRYHDTTV